MKLFIIFFTIFNINCEFTHKYTDIICHRNEFCKLKSKEFIDNGLTHSFQTPHCGLTSLKKFSNRLQGGYDSRIHKYPWYVALFTIVNGKYHYFCGGTIINKRFIMTAVHCVKSEFMIHGFLAGTNSLYMDDSNRIILRPMINNLSQYNIEFYIPEQDYSFTQRTDIALIKTSKPIEFLIKNDQFIVNSICLNHYYNDPGGKATIAAGGLTSYTTKSAILQEAELQIINIKKCQNAIREHLEREKKIDWSKEVNSNLICTMASVAPGLNKNHSKTVRWGDSGAALIQYKDGRAYAIGIATSGYRSYDAQINFHLRISKYVPWIKAVMDNASKKLARKKSL